MRIAAFLATATLVTAATATPGFAAPKLSGVYTLAGTQMCQAPVGRQGGDIEHQLGTATFTPTATGTGVKLVIKDQWGSSVATAGSIKMQSMIVTGTATISGSANPYALTLKMTVGTQTMTTTGFIQLDLAGATDGIARRAVIQSTSKNGEMAATNCTTQMLLFHQ
jgi:hypothetical protein